MIEQAETGFLALTSRVEHVRCARYIGRVPRMGLAREDSKMGPRCWISADCMILCQIR